MSQPVIDCRHSMSSTVDCISRGKGASNKLFDRRYTPAAYSAAAGSSSWQPAGPARPDLNSNPQALGRMFHTSKHGWDTKRVVLLARMPEHEMF
jgi:hypothetical protein